MFAKFLFIFPILLAGVLRSQEFSFLYDDFAAIPGDSIAEIRILELVNEARRESGLKPLISDRNLRSAARQHSREMLQKSYFSHQSPTPGLAAVSDRVYQTGCTDASLGENIAVHSQDVVPAGVARFLFEQWMNSPGHRANILKPEFTHLGVGVTSFRDSTVRDTLIRGVRTKVTRHTIRHYGTQVFSERGLTFSKLSIRPYTEDFLVLDLVFQTDRSMIVGLEQRTQFVYPAGGRVSAHVEMPYRPAMKLTLAMAQNEQTKEYVRIFEDSITSVLELYPKLYSLPILLLKKDVRIEKRTKWYLDARGELSDPSLETACHLYVHADCYYELTKQGRTVAAFFPLETDAEPTRYAFAVGRDLVKTVSNVVWVESAFLEKDPIGWKIFRRREP